MIILFYLIQGLMIIVGIIFVGLGFYWGNEIKHSWRGVRFFLGGIVLAITGLSAETDYSSVGWVSHYLTLPGLLAVVGIACLLLGGAEMGPYPDPNFPRWAGRMCSIGIILLAVFGSWWGLTAP